MATTPPTLVASLQHLPQTDKLDGKVVHLENYDAELAMNTAEIICTPITATPASHTMGAVLRYYVLPKVHTVIHSYDFDSILVLGCHDRSPSALITENEKANKPFNWQRPTAAIIPRPEGNTLELKVLPGQAYVEHYAALLSTHFASVNFTGLHAPTVHYRSPAVDACASIFADSNLPYLGKIDIAILGYVDKLPRCSGPDAWETGVSRETDGGELFAWKKQRLPDGRLVAFIGCTACYWGDIGGQLIRALRLHNQVQEVIYIGKLGTLNEAHIPNSILATGSCSLFPDGSAVEWRSVLEDAVKGTSGVVHGVHFTGATSLSETKDWTREWMGRVEWVDPEIGHMARVSSELGVGFGFLHVVSDNLSREGLEGLVDERKATIVADRMKLLQQADVILEKYFNQPKG